MRILVRNQAGSFLRAVLLFRVIVAHSASLQVNANAASFEYFPEHTVGDLRVSIQARRFLEVAWKGRNLLTQGGEIFTRRYQSAQLDGLRASEGPLGIYLMGDKGPEFDIPVYVERMTEALIYTWVCDAFEQGYLQVNRAVIQSNRVSVTTTLRIKTNAPAVISFHPVFFPGTLIGHSGGVPDPALRGRSFHLVDTNGKVSSQIYPAAPLETVWYGDKCASLSTDLPEGPVRITIRSEHSDFRASLYAFAKWPLSLFGERDRRGLVGHLSLPARTEAAPRTLTYEIVIDVGSSAASRLTEPSTAVQVDYLKLTPVLSGRNFWFFHPNEPIAARLRLDNRSSAAERNARLTWTMRDYGNAVVRQGQLQTNLPSSTMNELLLEFGPLERGAYSLEFNADAKGHVIGHTAVRIGVVPDHEVRDKANCLGGFQAYSDNVPQQIELMKWSGMAKARFRTSLDDARLSYFEPAPGQFVTNLPSVEIAKADIASGILLVYSGEHFPPRAPPADKLPGWLSPARIDQFYYDSATEKRGYLPKDIGLFEHYVREWASRFAGLVEYFEVFNEPNTKMDPAIAAQIIQLVSTNIKNVIPAAKVAACDIVDLSHSRLSWLQEVLELAYKQVDIITYHQYKQGWYKRSTETRFPIIEDTGWEVELQRIAALGKRFGKPVWNGEISWVGCPAELFPHARFSAEELDTANIQVRSYLLTRAKGIDTILQCYAPSLRNPDNSYIIYPERAAGLVGWGWMVKPWAVAHATLSDFLDTAKFVERVDLGDPKTYLLCFERPDRQFAAAWCSHGTATISNPFRDAEASFRSIVGQSLTPGGSIVLSESPIYVSSDLVPKDLFLRRVRSSRIVSPRAASTNLHLLPK